MKILFYTYTPDGNSLESRPPDEVEASIFTKVYGLVLGVQKQLPQLNLEWAVWFVNPKGEEVSANVQVDVVRNGNNPTSISRMVNRAEAVSYTVANFSTGVSGRSGWRDIEENASKVVEGLKRQLALAAK